MPNQFIRIGDETHFALQTSTNSILANLEDYVRVCKDMFEHVKTIAGGSVDYPSRSTEFHYYGVTGAPGGEILAPMLWSISHFPKFFARLTQAQTGLVIGSPIEILLASDTLTTVYTANHCSLHLLNQVVDTTSIENVTTLSWDTIRTSMPQVDFAQIVINYMADPAVFDAVVGAIKPGGLLIISNSSNGGELYNDSGTTSFPHELHRRLKEIPDFDIMHMQGYISYTLCTRRHPV
jgi:hypothetical protein